MSMYIGLLLKKKLPFMDVQTLFTLTTAAKERLFETILTKILNLSPQMFFFCVCVFCFLFHFVLRVCVLSDLYFPFFLHLN